MSYLKFLSLTLFLSLGVACNQVPLPKNTKAQTRTQVERQSARTYGPPRVIARLKSSEITEGSGIVASQAPGVYWTHNDSGDGPFVYAIDNRGKVRGVFRVQGAKARDWEDISAGPGPLRGLRYLYIGDIGDNNSRRSELVVYRIPEPDVNGLDGSSSRKKPLTTQPAEAFKIKYPDGRHDAETLLVHPISGDLYLITKEVFSNPVVYKATAPLNAGQMTSLDRKAELKVPSLLGGIITGGGIAPDGRRIALCDYMQGYEIVLPSSARNFDEIWTQPMKTIDLGRRSQGEAVTYRLDGNALIAISEGRSSPLIEVVVRTR